MKESSTEKRVIATLQAVDQICGELRDGALGEIPGHEIFLVELLLREALTNGVLHGTSAVCCEVERIERGVVLRVRDSGAGFDWRHYLHAPSAAAGGESGRGIHILRRYSSALRFNEAGNEIEVIRIFRQGDGHGKC